MLESWRLHAGSTCCRSTFTVKREKSMHGATNETADPQQQVALRTSMDLPRA